MGYADERLELISRLRRELPGRSLSDALRLDGGALRFRLGTSLADLRVPVHVDAQVAEVMRLAVRDLFFLLCVRHRPALRENEYDRLILLDGFDPRALGPASFIAPASVKSDNVRRAFLEAPELHPSLDSGLLASWIRSGRPGRVFVGTLNAILRRAHEDAGSPETPEPTPYLALLALRSLSLTALGTLKDLPVSGPVGRALHGAVAAGLIVAVRLAARESGVLDARCGLQALSAASVLPWLGGVRMAWGSGLTCHGVPFAEMPPLVTQHVQKLLYGGAVEAMERETAAELSASRESARKAARLVAMGLLRSELLQLVRMVEVGRAPAFSVEGLSLSQLFELPVALERVMGTPALRKDLAGAAKGAARGASNDAARKALESIAAAALAWKDEDPAAGIGPDAVVNTWSTAVASLCADAALDAAVARAEAVLVHRTGQESEGGIETQHEAGKLYLLSFEEKPLLMRRARAPQLGHLFCDMKDFTRRTAFLKETVVADFLSREFYGPILTAAGQHAQGAAHLADKGGIYLNNLLGDAISFSGDIVSLMQLASEIRRALGSYARRLDGEASRDAVARTIASIEEKFRGRKQELVSAMRSAQEAQRRGTLDPVSGEEPSYRLRVLAAEAQKLEEERLAEVSLATGEKLEAGIFVSFGSAPEVATFDDPVFGQVKVSIAEKINESARGTARNAGVRARVDAILAAERARLGKPQLTCPFAVAVSQSFSLSLPADVEVQVRRSVAAGDLEGAQALLGGAVHALLSRLAAQEPYADRGEIYNGGAAVSEEALDAYVAARGGDVLFLRREIQVAALHRALQDRFVFPTQSLRLLLALSPQERTLEELFVFSGRALFKGFEKQGGLGLYEMIGRENPFFALLAEHHVPQWILDHDVGQAESGEWQPVLLGNAG